MINLSTLLQNGNLTPKERVLLWVHNQVIKGKTGETNLSDADKKALQNWRAKNNYEAKEYNRYNDGWTILSYARLDAQTVYLNAVISLLYADKLVNFALWTDYENKSMDYLKRLEKFDFEIDNDMALEIILNNSGLELDKVIYGCAFENLSDDLKNDMKILYPDIETESGYLDQEEIVSSLFGGKDQLTVEAKEKLANLIIEPCRNIYADAIKEKGLKCDDWYLQGYYADLPVIEIAKKWAVDNKIYTKQVIDELETKKSDEMEKLLIEKMKEYAEKQATDIGELLKKTVLEWLDDGLFVTNYAPLCHSKDKETCNGSDTVLPHNKIFAEWIKAKTKAQTTIQNLIDIGKLKVENRNKEFLKIKETLKIITGKSLYSLEDDYVFAKEYKKQAEAFKLIGSLVIFLNQGDFLKEYATILGFGEIFKLLSKVYEIDLVIKINERIALFKVGIDQQNERLRHIADNMEMAIYKEFNITFHTRIFIDDMKIDIEKIVPNMDEELVKHYHDEFRKVLGDEYYTGDNANNVE